MKHIFELYYDPIDMSCCVDTQELIRTLESKMSKDNLFFPFYQKNKTLREVMQYCNYDTFSYRFGSIADNILGVLFEDKNGLQYQIGARVVKNVTGFDFTRFFCQNENEFGVIKRAILRLRPKPEAFQQIVLLDSKDNCEKFCDLILHSVWATSLMGMEFIGNKKEYKVIITIGGNNQEIEILTKAILSFSAKIPVRLAVQNFEDGNKAEYLASGNLLLSKNIELADYLIKQYGGVYKGFLGNGVFLYNPQETDRFISSETEIVSKLQSYKGSIYWKQQKKQCENLSDIRKQLLLAMKD